MRHILLAVILCCSLPLRANAEELVDKVRKSIERGIGFLRDLEKGEGHWEHDIIGARFKGGESCLAILALLNAGIKADDPIIERGLRYIRQLQRADVYVVSLQTMIYVEAGRNEDRERIQKNVEWLIEARVMEGDRCMGWGYNNPGGRPDNSNTQYALLGLHAGHLAGAKVERQVWQSIQNFYRDTQKADSHGWSYHLYESSTRITMTTAGVCGLLISGMELNPGREVFEATGSVSNCGIYEASEPIRKAMGWLGSNFRLSIPGGTYYNLYGIERTGRLSGQRFIGQHDWYREGCIYLVDRQLNDGSWHELGMHDQFPIISTSFALLFLSKGRTPVLISKLVHGPGDDWNNDRNDARNLTEYASKELFRRTPLAWQVFDTNRLTIRNNDELLDLTKELLQSPIVYFNGHLGPLLTDVQKSLLKKYVEQGGFILAEACCGRPEFDAGFRQLMRELFPDQPLRRLPSKHPIWMAHAAVLPSSFPLEGIEYGCKTVVIYSPKDLSCYWEGNLSKTGQGQVAFRLGGNIIAYATGLELPKNRLSPTEVILDDPEGKQIRRNYLKAAQLRHEGDWQPAPNAMRNLLADLRSRAGLDVDLQTKSLQLGNPDPELMDFKFLYLHGRGAFNLSSAAVANLRERLETGGLLLADAACGKSAFDNAFRELIGKVFPDKKLEPIPLADELYSAELNGTTIKAVKCRRESPGQFKEMPPALEGIKLGNRWVVIYSKYDLGCALEKHQSSDCLGHDHTSALQLAGAAVLYYLKR